MPRKSISDMISTDSPGQSAGAGQRVVASLTSPEVPESDPRVREIFAETIAEHPAKASPETARAIVRRSRHRESAREAVIRSGNSARNESRSWVPFKPYLPGGLTARMLRRLAADQAASDKPTHLSGHHYLNAALERVPADAGAAAKWALAWRAREEWEVPGPGPVPGSKAHAEVARAMHLLRTALRGLEQPVRLWEVQAEALARLLDELDAEDQAAAD